jgi:AraC family transcriptional regulator
MNSLLDKIVTQIRMTPTKETEVYPSDKLVIFRPDTLIEQETSFDSYHFVIPSSPMPSLIVDKKVYNVRPGTMFLTNPDQSLAVSKQREVSKYTAVFMDKEFFQSLNNSLYTNPRLNFINGNMDLDSNLLFHLQQLIKEAQIKQSGYKFMIDSLATQVGISLLRNINGDLTPREYSYCINKVSINRAIEYIMENSNNDFSMEDVAKAANFSPFHFIRTFKKHTGKTPYQFLIDVKVEKAKELLQRRDYNITEISMICGFSNASHFNTTFKRKTGMSPTCYRSSVITPK